MPLESQPPPGPSLTPSVKAVILPFGAVLDYSLLFRRTRREFQEWCNTEAGKHGYKVSFRDLGHAMQEAEALTNPELPAIETDVGGSTQVQCPLCISSSPLPSPPFPQETWYAVEDSRQTQVHGLGWEKHACLEPDTMQTPGAPFLNICCVGD